MAQSPYQVDQLQIEPSLAGTRLINAHADGDLQFQDPNVTVLLSALVGLRNVTGLFIVGRGGDGAPYTTIQDAVDDVPDTSSATAPSLILVTAGAYSENIVIDKDGVFLVGLGGVTITNAVADATVKVADAPTTTPQLVVLQNLTIENTDAGEECVLVEGAGTYASGSITVNTAPLAAGDTMTIGGVVLTGVSGTRTSGSDNFSIDGTTVDAIAAEAAEALNDPANSFAATVVATSTLGVIAITAVVAGAAGNAITLATSTTPPGGLTESGATLTGGGSSGSEVALQEVAILDCNLVASGIGTYQVRGDTVNNIRVQGGTWRGGSSSSQVLMSNCAAFRVFGVEWVNHLELAYDSVLDQPSIITSVYEAKGCGVVGDVLCNLVGEGSLQLAGIPSVGDVTFGGDRTFEADHCRLGNLTLSDTTVTSLVSCTRGTATAAVGTPTLQESSLAGSTAFAASAAETVPFSVDQPDALYAVQVDSPILGTDVKVTAKTASDFTISATAPITGTVYWTVERQL